MVIKRQFELFPVLGAEPEPAPSSNNHHKCPGEHGYPQFRALEKLRRQKVTCVRKLNRK